MRANAHLGQIARPKQQHGSATQSSNASQTIQQGRHNHALEHVTSESCIMGLPHTRKRNKRMGSPAFGHAPKAMATTAVRNAQNYERLHIAWAKRRALHTSCKQTPHTCHEHTCTAYNPSNTEACACALVHNMQVYRYVRIHGGTCETRMANGCDLIYRMPALLVSPCGVRPCLRRIPDDTKH